MFVVVTGVCVCVGVGLTSRTKKPEMLLNTQDNLSLTLPPPPTMACLVLNVSSAKVGKLVYKDRKMLISIELPGFSAGFCISNTISPPPLSPQ